MKKSLLASALIAMLITATAFVSDAQAAPHRGGHRGGAPAKQTTQVQKPQPKQTQARSQKAPSYKPAQVKQRTEARPMPKQVQPAPKRDPQQARPPQKPKSVHDRVKSNPNQKPTFDNKGKTPFEGKGFDKGKKGDNKTFDNKGKKGDNKTFDNKDKKGDNKTFDNKGKKGDNKTFDNKDKTPFEGKGFDKDKSHHDRKGFDNKDKTPFEGKGFDKDKSHHDRKGFDNKDKPPFKGKDFDKDKPHHDRKGFDRPPHDRPPHYRSRFHPPHHHHYHGRYHLYYGIFVPPIIYGGCYYETIADNDAIIENFTYIQPSEHPNQFLFPLLRENGHPDDAVFCVTYDGQEAYQYDLLHGTGSFYRIAIENEPKARKWKADPPTNPTPPYISSLDDLLYKYHFTPSPTALFDGKHLYKFDVNNRTFTENQTIEGLTSTYKHGDIYLIHATPKDLSPYPKYYLVLPDAIYETQADLTHGYIDFNELNHDTKKLWKIIK